MDRITVRSSQREQMLDVTARVEAAVAETGVENGLAHVFSMHTTAGVTVNENADPDVVRDILSGLARVAPHSAEWRHGEGNSDAHVKTTLVGPGVTIPVVGGRLALGTWQAVYLCEFDGPRARDLLVTVVAADR